MTEKTISRRPRSDRGPRLTDRDLRVLRWIAEQYAVRLDQVRVLLSPTETDLISETRLRQIMQRWSAGGWIHTRRWLADEPPWVWVSAAGLRLLDLEDFKYAPPAATRLRHIHAVNQVRAYVERMEQKSKKGRTWTSERWLRAGLDVSKKGTKIGPIPDGEVTLGAGRAAVEVELTTKKRDDLVKKLAALVYKIGDPDPQRLYQNLPYYQVVWFFTSTEALKSRVEEARGQLRDSQDRVIVYMLADYLR